MPLRFENVMQRSFSMRSNRMKRTHLMVNLLESKKQSINLNNTKIF